MKPKKHVVYYPGTKKKYREWYTLNDKRHREDGPASIHYYKNGNIKMEYYYINGKRHREDGPSDIYYYENGNISSEYYYINGNIQYEWYYINGKELTKHEFNKYIRKRDSKIFDKLLEEMANEN